MKYSIIINLNEKNINKVFQILNIIILLKKKINL